MATLDNDKKVQTKTKSKEKRQAQSKSSGSERLKTVVRRLPPNLPEEIFWQSVHPWVTEETVLWKSFYPGKLRKKLNKENIHSRAYIAFKTEELLATFSRDYDGHIFRDKAGNESQAVVEFAPSQKIPLEKKKVDGRNATIEKDEEFIAFMQSLETPAAKPYDAEQLLENLIASTERQPMPKSTPLLEALKAEKSAQKDKEAILNNHSHYKDGGSGASGSKKEDSKKKGGAAAKSAAAGGEAPPTMGKRAAKRAAQAAAAAAQKSGQPSGPPVKATAPLAAMASPSKAGPSGAPKGGRGGRQPALAQPQESQPSKGAVSSSTPAAPPPAVPPADSVAGGSSSQSNARRPRPVLGIASRQFEAALSGAGVAKVRRERHADKEKEAGKDGSAAEEKKEGGKGKEREGRRNQERAHGGGALSASTPASVPPAQAGVLPAPTIMQRDAKQQVPRIAQRPAEHDATPGIVNALTGPEPGAGRSFGKPRGRGRGRVGPSRGG
ncbi:hypothetical protein BV25DRAFT_1004676 [Artomyces pyxidatus]|uniref:Uncharacterized protein n=1 Tax=Artomyces pyxidatus TaxID=48021 RepID=A0ACB8SU32_9AGAM|nr:hypothetical protein BV25DRAFT_1004676 [Artomyces pyxidatus]